MTNDFKITVENVGPNVQWRSSRGFEWTRLELVIANLPQTLVGFRIIHLADLHCRNWWDPAYDDLAARLQANPPDLILFGGDFVESKIDARPALPIVRKLLPKLVSRLGIFAILGNHDGDLIGPPIAAMGVRFIEHRRLRLTAGSASLELIGLPGVDRLDLDEQWVAGLEKKRPGVPRIVLSHYPDLLTKVAALQPDIYLAGHTHGGQICLPNRLPIIRHSTLPRELCTGIHNAYGTVLVSNRGFGFSSPLTLRAWCPAEVVEIILHPAAL
jgi:predicted MPP superfamily phosphohydrolase